MKISVYSGFFMAMLVITRWETLMLVLVVWSPPGFIADLIPCQARAEISCKTDDTLRPLHLAARSLGTPGDPGVNSTSGNHKWFWLVVWNIVYFSIYWR